MTTAAAEIETAGSVHKLYATLQARAAIAGFAIGRSVSATGQPIYVVSRWNSSRKLQTLDDVETWLTRAAGADVHHDPGRLERDRRAVINAANRAQDVADEALDLARGPGGAR